MISLHENEKVLFEIRKHWFVFFLEIAYLIVLVLVPVLFFSSFNLSEIFNGQVNITWIQILFFFLLYFLIIWIQFFVFWTDYYLDAWTVTNQRIVDVEQKSLFRREVSIMHFNKIQDVTAEVNGILGSLINYGDIEIQTAATDRKFKIRGVKNPIYLQKKINEMVLKFHDQM